MSQPQSFLVKVPDFLRDQLISRADGPRNVIGHVEIGDPSNPEKTMSLSLDSQNGPIVLNMRPLKKANPPYILYDETSPPDIESYVPKQGENPPQRKFQRIAEVEHVFNAPLPPHLLGSTLQAKLMETQMLEKSKYTKLTDDIEFATKVEEEKRQLLQQNLRHQELGKGTKEKRVRSSEQEVLKQIRSHFAIRPHYTFDELFDRIHEPREHLQQMLDKYCKRHQSGELAGKYELRNENMLL